MELLYADDLVLVAETEDLLLKSYGNRRELKGTLENSYYYAVY